MGMAQKCRASGRNGAGDSSNSNAENSSTTTSGGSTNTGSSASCKELTKVKRTRKRKSAPRESPLQRSSAYRGVTRHRWTGRYEAHLWDKDWCNAPQKKKGRQVYLGAYDDEEAAARAYDLAALKYWGRDTALNFPLSAYQAQLKEMEGLSREEYVGSLRRKSSGFSRGVSKYRGVARHHHNGRWEARIGRVFGNKYLYLGTYATQEEAATAYDMAAIEYRGLNAVTNFDISRYAKYLRPSSADKPNPQSSHGGSNSDHHSPVLPVDAPPLNLHQHQEVAGGTSPGSQPRTADSPSALGLLLHSSKLKQMLERASMSEGPPTPPESYDGLPPSTRGSFPEDVQTYFECQDGGGGGFADVDDFIFGGLDSLVSSVFQWELVPDEEKKRTWEFSGKSV